MAQRQTAKQKDLKSPLNFILFHHAFTITSSCVPQDPREFRLPSQSSSSHFCCWTTEVQDSSPDNALQYQGELCGKWMAPVLHFRWQLCGSVSRLVVNLIYVDVCPQNSSFLLKISSLFSPVWRNIAWMSRLGSWHWSLVVQQITLGWFPDSQSREMVKEGWDKVKFQFPWCLYKEQIRVGFFFCPLGYCYEQSAGIIHRKCFPRPSLKLILWIVESFFPPILFLT